MKIYASDLLDTDHFIPKHDDRLVAIDWIEPVDGMDKITVFGYFLSNGDPYERVLDFDAVIDVRESDESN